jgi:hypothetical protein
LRKSAAQRADKYGGEASAAKIPQKQDSILVERI